MTMSATATATTTITTTTQDQDHHILLDPTQLKQIVNALPKNQKRHHDLYEYADTEDLKTELNEFFDYNEIKHLLADQEATFKEWRSMKSKEQRKHIHGLLTAMKKKKTKTEGKKSLLHQEQINAAKQLICLILCGPNVQSSSDDDEDRKLYQLTQTIVCIIHYGGLTLVCRRLKRIMNKISASNNVTKDIMMEMDMYLTLAYLIIETRRQLKLDPSSSDHHLDPSFIECLFCFISTIQDAHVEQLPMRKMLLVLWKSMLVTFGGGLEQVHAIQQQQQSTTTVTNKSTIQDYYKFVEETTERYPGYQAPKSMLPSPLAVKATTSTLSAMGLVTASHQVDLPYQAYCNGKSSSGKKKSKSSHASPPDFPVALPLDATGPSVPFSVVEANQVYLDHLHTSNASQQLIQQREQAMQSSCSSSTTTSTPSDDIIHPSLDRFEEFYKCIVPELQNVVVFFLKQLLTTIAPSSPCLDDTPEHVASLRNSQVVCKSISAILLLFLKWTKLSHVLKFEYISQLLVDSGCILLILKIIGLQDVVSLVSNNETDRDPLCLFKTHHPCGEYTNNRNMFWMISLLRVLQKLTKNKPNRVMVMVQYKSSTVFKKVLKISHPMMELYTLKLLKSQVPFQTRKWRANNMKIISAIYLKCTTSLYDDWMGKTETEDDLMDGKAEEINIRLLARIYHGERYNMPELLPVLDDAISETWSSSPSASSSATTFHRDNDNEEDVFDTDELELDPSFVANYEIWLDDEVYRDDECLTIEVDDQIEELDMGGLQDEFLSIDLEEDEEIELDVDDDDDGDTTIELLDDDDESDDTCLGTPVPKLYTTDYFDNTLQDDMNELVDPTTQMDTGGAPWMSHHQQQTWTCPPSPIPSRPAC